MGPLSDEGLVQLLDADGTRVGDPDWEPYASHLTPEALRLSWRLMTLTRAFDAEATSLQRQGELGLWVSCLGQEAAQIGSGTAIREPDYVFPSYREHGVALTRSVDLPQMLTLFRGLEHGSWDPAQHSFHLYTLVIGAHTLHATGYAMAMDRDGLVASGQPDKDGAVVCYFGDGATSQGDVNEAFVFASVNNAPIVFFIQNNQFAISEPTTRQSRVTLAQRADGFGIPRVRVDGNDVIAVHAVTQWALRHARAGQGPVLIEAFTYRMAAHTTSDDPTRYRSHADEEKWRQRDPIARLEKHLDSLGELSQEYRDEVAAEAKALGKRTRETVKSWERPPLLTMFDHVYAEPHAQVEAERAWFDRYQQSFIDEGSHA
ncbi:pyruvate dehydrogenase (acetyl-transferring) E1 component subunit alpha [Demequina sp. NBRC 110054]|uniref:pyruvate dehydrogenase (acetyl-transferring) E1 component subunit alpha n=1 Tax=Demequina sp. NBRC 110054 TaxID=1570343 RepID=UPI0009FBAC23|nr:pyruvate dehydrogenase (acetyl-transferring) E1 component subunit alpha [Demequina sp. NBRC 110054]